MATAYNQNPVGEGYRRLVVEGLFLDGSGDDLTVPNIPGVGEGDSETTALYLTVDWSTRDLTNAIVSSDPLPGSWRVPEGDPLLIPPFTSKHGGSLTEVQIKVTALTTGPVYIGGIAMYGVFTPSGDANDVIGANIVNVHIYNQTNYDLYFIAQNHPSLTILNGGPTNIGIDGTPGLVVRPADRVEFYVDYGSTKVWTKWASSYFPI